MKFEIDVSGYDLFNDLNYIICISNCCGLIRGFKFNREIVNELKKNWKSNKYFCKFSKRNTGFFKSMIYSSVICCLFEKVNVSAELNLVLCRDFRYHENNIKQRLNKLLRKRLNIKPNSIGFLKLGRDSDAHNYVFMMHKDKYNLLSTYVDLSLEDIEKFLL